MSIENDLKRIADALETIAAKSGTQQLALPMEEAKVTKVETNTQAKEETAPVDNAEKKDAKAERDEVKKALTEKGITFNNKAATPTLQKLLDNHTAPAQETVVAKEEPVKEEAVTEGAPAEVTLATAREKMQTVINELGKEVAKELVGKIGKPNLSAMTPGDLANLVKLANEKLSPATDDSMFE